MGVGLEPGGDCLRTCVGDRDWENCHSRAGSGGSPRNPRMADLQRFSRSSGGHPNPVRWVRYCRQLQGAGQVPRYRRQPCGWSIFEEGLYPDSQRYPVIMLVIDSSFSNMMLDFPPLVLPTFYYDCISINNAFI